MPKIAVAIFLLVANSSMVQAQTTSCTTIGTSTNCSTFGSGTVKITNCIKVGTTVRCTSY